MKMRWYILFLFVILILLVGCTKVIIIDKEKISDNAELIEKEIEGHTMFDINYTWNGKQYQNYFDYRYKDSFEWIKANLNQNDKILCWWDYGHMIRGYTGIDVVIYAPSKDILNSVADKKGPEELMDSEIVHDVAYALATDDHKDTLDIMKQYNASYLFITQEEKEDYKGRTIASIAGKELNDNSIITRATHKGEIPSFLVAYEDNNVMIYKIRGE